MTVKTTGERVLVVDDEKELVEGLKYNLEVEGYVVECAYDGEQALAAVRRDPPSLLLLDVMMPGINGLKVLEILREEGDRTPIILLTAKSQPEDKVTGLEIGADDYVTKPFGLPELMARIRAVLRRVHPDVEPVAEVFRFEGLTVDFRRYVIEREGKEWPLSRFESDILRYLIAHRDEVVTRHDLLTKVWGYVNLPTTRTVDNHIARLRKKVEDSPDEPEHILTVHGIGYRFVAAVVA
ncbi:MAG: DNA-binding response regulator [Planctomycetes bacterium]|jgi:DNA-binding response OmpR family regulator|nr:DNA-binding response regulator [Planctomycetota bacterium]